MRRDRLTRYLKGFVDSVNALLGRSHGTEFSNPRRYRLDFIAENTFNRVWTIRFSRPKLLFATLTVVAAIAALMFVIVFFTPVRSFLPGKLDDDLRSRYVDMALSLDSLEQEHQLNKRYFDNIGRVLGIVEDELQDTAATETTPIMSSDSLLLASEAEQAFVKRYEEEDRFNLSVLTPIAAEVMAFYSPVDGASEEPELVGQVPQMRFIDKGLLAISSVYRGTVVARYQDNEGRLTLLVQHPNDFVSIYSGLNDCFVNVGDKLLAGQRIGHSGNGKPFGFELWHNGSATNPGDYIAF